MVLISLVPTLVLMVFYVSTFRRMCAVLHMAFFCSSRTSWLPGMLPTYFLSDFEMVPVAPIITGITVVFTFHIRWISIVRSLYFKKFSASFLITFLSPEMETSISMHVLFSLSRIIISGLLLGIVLSVRTCWSHLSPLGCFYWFWHMFRPVFCIHYYYYYYYYYYLPSPKEYFSALLLLDTIPTYRVVAMFTNAVRGLSALNRVAEP